MFGNQRASAVAALLTKVSLHSADLERTSRFYAAIGVEMRWQSFPSGDRYLLIDAAGVVLEFRPGDRYGKEPWVTVEFDVDSVYGRFVSLQGEGYNPFGTARTRDDSCYAWMQYTDPDGHIVVIAAREADAEPGAAPDTAR